MIIKTEASKTNHKFGVQPLKINNTVMIFVGRGHPVVFKYMNAIQYVQSNTIYNVIIFIC